jgi:hypothetical protein
MQAQRVMQRQPEQESVDAATIRDRHQQVEEMADAAYDAIVDEVASFFSGVIDQGSGVLQAGWIDVETDDGEPDARYRGRLGGEGRRETVHRYLPTNDWDTYVQDVYAPLAATAAALEQATAQETLSQEQQETIAAIDTDYMTAPDAEDAAALYADVSAVLPVDDISVRQPVYPRYAEET